MLENDFITILQEEIILDNTAYWEIYNVEYPWSSNGNLLGNEEFEIPWKYLKASKVDGHISISVCDSM